VDVPEPGAGTYLARYMDHQAFVKEFWALMRKHSIEASDRACGCGLDVTVFGHTWCKLRCSTWEERNRR
jgi:hypothetical protein